MPSNDSEQQQKKDFLVSADISSTISDSECSQPSMDELKNGGGGGGADSTIGIGGRSNNGGNGGSGSGSGSGTANVVVASRRGNARRRLTSHRKTLHKLHSDLSDGRSARYSVPDPSVISRTDAIAGTESQSQQKQQGLKKKKKKKNGDDDYDDQVPPPESAAYYGNSPDRWVEKHQQICKETCSQRSCHEWTSTLLPMYRWLRTYQWKEFLVTDLLAGLTVGVMIVPQSMSYAKLAGLPVEFGLYSSLVPIYAYAFFGSSRQLAVGPVALVSLLLNAGLTQMLEKLGKTPENTPDYSTLYESLALQVSVIVGVCYLIMGFLRLGFVTIFLSHAVVSGFTSAAAVVIGLSQIKYLFGYDIPSDKALHKMLNNIFSKIEEFNWKTFVLGSICVSILIGLKKLAQKFPTLKWTKAVGPLVVTVITIILQATIDLEEKGIPVVGKIPSGFPKFFGSYILPFEEQLGDLSIVVLSIVIVGFMESIAISKQLASKNNYEVDSSMELIGLGMANLTSGLFGGYPVTGSFSRSAVNNESGAQSGISAMVTATVVGLVLLFLTPVFELLPLPVLASIVISGVVSLVDYPEAIYLWNVHKFDFWVWMFAFVGTLFLGVELGLGIAVGISLLIVIFESAYPHTAVLGRLPGTHQYRNIKQYTDAERYDGIVMVRIDAPIYFANSQNVREKVLKYYERAEEELVSRRRRLGTESLRLGSVKYIILELGPVSHVDTSALHILHDMNASYRKNKQIQLCLSNPNPNVMRRLVTSGLADEIGLEHIFVSLHDAVGHCLHEMDLQELSMEPTEIEDLLKDVEPSAATSQNHHIHQVRSENTIRDFTDERVEVYDVEVGLTIEEGDDPTESTEKLK